MSLSYYDLLDVDPSAGPDEIRAAWRRAVEGLDPTDRRFRAYNAAAETLLDPEKRVEYDVGLAAEAISTPEEDAAHTTQPSSARPARRSGRAAPTASPTHDQQGVITERQRRTPPAWLLVALALSTLVALAIGAWILRTPSDAEVEEQTRAAQAAAERAVVPLLSYDAGNLEESKQAAHAVLTDRYRKTYDQFFEGVVQQNAPNTGTRIEVRPPLASAIARSGQDRVQVLLFVDRPTTNKKTSTPVVYKDQVTLTMVRRGDRWLVDGIDTTPLAE